MNTLDKILELLQEQGLTQRQLCEHLGLKQQAFTNWKNGHTDSWKKYLPQIADFFGVSVDYLLGKEQQKNSPPSEEDRLLDKAIELMKKLSPEEQAQAMKYLAFLADSSKKQ